MARPAIVKSPLGYFEARCHSCYEYHADTGKRDIEAWAKNHVCSYADVGEVMATFADLANRRKDAP